MHEISAIKSTKVDLYTKMFFILCLKLLDPCASNPCQNGAVCNNVPAFNDYHCTCGPIYQGKNCEIVISKLR